MKTRIASRSDNTIIRIVREDDCDLAWFEVEHPLFEETQSHSFGVLNGNAVFNTEFGNINILWSKTSARGELEKLLRVVRKQAPAAYEDVKALVDAFLKDYAIFKRYEDSVNG